MARSLLAACLSLRDEYEMLKDNPHLTQGERDRFEKLHVKQEKVLEMFLKKKKNGIVWS